jgi:formylmethanofuran dehydrogenase subunit D
MTLPPVHHWEGRLPGSSPGPGSPPGGNGKLRLWAGRKLYDAGVAVTHSAAVSGLAATDTIRLHPDEFGRLVAAAGASVRVTSARGSVTLPVFADRAVPPGVAWMPPGAAADLVDVAAPVTTVSVEVAGG